MGDELADTGPWRLGDKLADTGSTLEPANSIGWGEEIPEPVDVLVNGPLGAVWPTLWIVAPKVVNDAFVGHYARSGKE